MKISTVKQLIKFSRAAIEKGWFSQWLETGDVIARRDRERITKQVNLEYCRKLSALLDEEPKR